MFQEKRLKEQAQRMEQDAHKSRKVSKSLFLGVPAVHYASGQIDFDLATVDNKRLKHRPRYGSIHSSRIYAPLRQVRR